MAKKSSSESSSPSASPKTGSAAGSASGSKRKSKNSSKASSSKNGGQSKIKAWLRFLFKVVAVLAVVFLVLAYSPGLLDIEPVAVAAPPPRPFTGPLEPNGLLERVEKLFDHQIVGPESIAFYKGDLYTGLHNGWIVRIKDDKTIEPIVTVGDPKCEPWEEAKCGRPLGLRFDRNGSLYFVDSYNGLFKVDVHTGALTPLYRSSEPVNGKKSLIPDDLDVSASGTDIYFTDASTKFPLYLGIYETLETAPNGRVLHYNVKTNKTRLLVDGVAFANGVQLSPKEDFLLVCETTRSRILKHHLTGAKKGETEVFLDNLPGAPDNIRSNGRGGYWLPMVVACPPWRKSILAKLHPYPMVRKVIARFLDVIRASLKFIDTLYPLASTKNAIYKVAHMLTYTSMAPSYGLILELDGDGRIVRSLHAANASFAGYVSEVHQRGQHLYLGSPWNGFLAKLTL